jgi:hypothetical protein
MLSGDEADRERVLALGRRYGELDGELSYRYAVAFAKVGRSLSKEQRAAAAQLRDLEGYESAAAYVYSQPFDGELAPHASDRFFAPARQAPGK